MPTIPYTPEALDLLHQGTIAFAEMEIVGAPVDVDYIEKTIKRTKRKIDRLQEALEDHEVTKQWRKRFRSKTNLDSHAQLADVLFKVMGYEAPTRTPGGKDSTNQDALETIEDPFVDAFLKIQKLKKAIGTNFNGILREVVNGRLHPFHNLNNARSYRSSCDAPNLYNQPIRDPIIGPLVRQAFIASAERQLVEIDFSGAEVRTSASCNKDPVLIEYILDPTKDMHRDMAVEIFKLPVEEVNKGTRYEAKSDFVFAEFYGSWYINVAPAIWKASRDLVTVSGMPMRDWLASKGITELGALNPKAGTKRGTFEHQVKRVEDAFWGTRFKVYAQWKDDWYADYQKKGWFKTVTGFICQGYMTKNQAVNYPIQGPSFHCLLWCVIQIMRIMKTRGMKTQIINQIYDSIVADVVPEELDEYLAICKRVITKNLSEHFKWMIIPMVAEVGICPVGTSWWDKKEMELK